MGEIIPLFRRKGDAIMTGDEDLVFHPLQKLEVITRGEQEAYVRRLFEESGATGYTLVRDVAGKGG
jgi:hypothetical protein